MPLNFQDDLFTISKDQKRIINLKRTLFTLLYSIFILSTAILVLNQYYSLPGIVAIGFNGGIFLCLYIIVEWFNLPTFINCKSVYNSIHRKIRTMPSKKIFRRRKTKEFSDKKHVPEKEIELEEFTDSEYKENSSDLERESGAYNFVFEHHPSIPKAASDDWVASMPRLQKQVMSTEYYTSKFYMLKGVDLTHWGIASSYPSFTQIFNKTTEFVKVSIDICLRQTQTPAYQTGHIIKSMLWSGVYIWATTKMYRANNNDPWSFKNIPEIYYFFESTFLWMLSYDYIIGLMAIWYRKESTIRYIFSFYQIVDFLSLPPFLLLIITISPLYESSQSWLLIFGWLRFLRLFRTENVLDMLFPHISAIKRRIIGIFAGAITIILTHAGAIFTIESPSQKNYNTLFDYFYYSIVTIGTVGYGDFSPQKREGRLVTIIVITLTLVLLPHEFQRLKEALNTPPASIGSFIRKNDTFICIIGPIPPKQLLYIIKNLSQQKQRKFKSVVLITPIYIVEYQNVVKISQQRGYIRISIKHGSIGSAINSIVQCSSFVLIYGSEGMKYIQEPDKNKEMCNDFDALLAAMCLSNLKGLNEKLFLIFYSSQVALMTAITGVSGSISIEIMKTKLLSKCISNCPGFVTIVLHFILPKNESMLKKLQEPPKNAYFISQADKSMITPYEWKCRWRGLHFKVYTFKFPSSFHGYPIKIFTKYIYKHLGIFLIGIYCPDTHKTYLNPHMYIIGENSNNLYESSNYMGIVLSSSLSLVKKAELLESPKRYEGFISKIGKKSYSPLFNLSGRNNATFNNRNCSFEFKEQIYIQENSSTSEFQKKPNHTEKYLNKFEKNQNLGKIPESIQLKRNLDNSVQIREKRILDGIQISHLTNLNQHSISYDDQGPLSENLRQVLVSNSENSFLINEGNNNIKYSEAERILPSQSTCYSQININYGSDINSSIPVVSSYTEAISKIFVNREYPLVVIIGWYERIDILIKSAFSLRPSNFIILYDKKFDSRYIQEEFLGKIAQVKGVGTSTNDQKQAGVLIASRIIIFDSSPDSQIRNSNRLIDVNHGMFAVSSWLTMCFIFSKYKKNDHNSCLINGRKMPPFIIDIKESDIGLLMFQYTDYCSTRIDGSMNSATYKSDYLLDFFYSRQFLSGQFFVDDIINSMVPFLTPILDNNPINKSFIEHLIDGHPCWKPFNNLRHTIDEKSCNLQLEEIPFIFVNSTFYNLFSQLLRHGRLAIGIFRPLRIDDRQYSQKQKQKNFASPNIVDYPSIIIGNSILDCFNCETHIIISCPPPKFKINLGDCVYLL